MRSTYSVFIIFSVKKLHCLILIPNPLISFSIKAFARLEVSLSPFLAISIMAFAACGASIKLRAKASSVGLLGFSVLSSAHFLISEWLGPRFGAHGFP